MNKFIKIVLLAYCLVNLQLTLAEDSSANGSDSVAEEQNESEEFHIVGEALTGRHFYITINSALPLMTGGKSAFSALGWFFSALGNMKNKIKDVASMKRFDIPDVLFKLKIIEVKLNQNYANAVDFKSTVTKRNKEAETAILISNDGFACDESFCELAGNKKYGMGICTPYYCDCTKEVPHSNRCLEVAQVFDPVYMNCYDAYKVKICGF